MERPTYFWILQFKGLDFEIRFLWNIPPVGRVYDGRCHLSLSQKGFPGKLVVQLKVINTHPFRAPTAWLCNDYIIGQLGTLWSKGSANFTVATWHETTWHILKEGRRLQFWPKKWQILQMSICTNGITNVTKFSYHLLHWPTLAFYFIRTQSDCHWHWLKVNAMPPWEVIL